MLTVSPIAGLFEPPAVKPEAGGGGGFAPLIQGLLDPDGTMPDCTLLPPDGETLPVGMPVIARPVVTDGDIAGPVILVAQDGSGGEDVAPPADASPTVAVLSAVPLRFAAVTPEAKAPAIPSDRVDAKPDDLPQAEQTATPQPPGAARTEALAFVKPPSESTRRAALLVSVAALPPTFALSAQGDPLLAADAPLVPDTRPSLPAAAASPAAMASPRPALAEEVTDTPQPSVEATPTAAPARHGKASRRNVDPEAEPAISRSAEQKERASECRVRVGAEPSGAATVSPDPALVAPALVAAPMSVAPPAAPRSPVVEATVVASRAGTEAKPRVAVDAVRQRPNDVPLAVNAPVVTTSAREADVSVPPTVVVSRSEDSPARVEMPRAILDAAQPAAPSRPTPEVRVAPTSISPVQAVAPGRETSRATLPPAVSAPLAPTPLPPAAIPAPADMQGAAVRPDKTAALPITPAPPATAPIVAAAPAAPVTRPVAAATPAEVTSAAAAPSSAKSLPQAAAPVPQPEPRIILPALQAFGAAMRQAIAEQRKPARSGTDIAADPIAFSAPIASPATAASVVPADTALDTADRRWPHAMAEHIERLRDAADATSTRIRLLPDALGPVDVAVRRDGDQVHVHFTAAEAQTRQLLADAQPRLADAADARGLRLGRTDVSGGAPAGGERQQQQRPAPQAPLPVRPASARIVAAAADDSDTRIA